MGCGSGAGTGLLSILHCRDRRSVERGAVVYLCPLRAAANKDAANKADENGGAEDTMKMVRAGQEGARPGGCRRGEGATQRQR